MLIVVPSLWIPIDKKDSESGMTFDLAVAILHVTEMTFGSCISVNFDWISLKMEEWTHPLAFCRKPNYSDVSDNREIS